MVLKRASHNVPVMALSIAILGAFFQFGCQKSATPSFEDRWKAVTSSVKADELQLANIYLDVQACRGSLLEETISPPKQNIITDLPSQWERIKADLKTRHTANIAAAKSLLTENHDKQVAMSGLEASIPVGIERIDMFVDLCRRRLSNYQWTGAIPIPGGWKINKSFEGDCQIGVPSTFDTTTRGGGLSSDKDILILFNSHRGRWLASQSQYEIYATPVPLDKVVESTSQRAIYVSKPFVMVNEGWQVTATLTEHTPAKVDVAWEAAIQGKGGVCWARVTANQRADQSLIRKILDTLSWVQ